MICKICDKQMKLGDNATFRGHDACTGVERDRDGFAWTPGENEQNRVALKTHEWYIVTREQAFTEGDKRLS